MSDSVKRTARGEYSNGSWFESEYIHEILRACKLHTYSFRRTVKYLKRLKQSDNTQPYPRLSHSTLASWFDKDHQLLPKYQQLLSHQHTRRRHGKLRALHDHPEVETELAELFSQMRSSGQPMNRRIVRAVMRGVLEERCPHVLEKLKLSDSFISAWVRSKMEWRWRLMLQ